MRAVRLALFTVLLAATPLFARDAPTIASLSPSSIYVASGEWFLTIDGSHYLPSAGVSVVFNGPGGRISLFPGAVTDTRIVVWVPFPVLLNQGDYLVTVEAPDGRNTLTSNAMNLRIAGNSLLLQVPALLLVEATSLEGGIGRFDVTATSVFGGETIVECSHKSGELFPFDVTKVDCRATDEFGGEASETFEIHVADTTPPAISVPRDPTAFGKSDGSVVKYDVTAKDVVDPDVSAKCSPESGSLFPVGTTAVTCTSFDRFRNAGTATFRVHVGDEETPALIVPPSVAAEASSRDGAAVSYDVSAVDAAGKPADVRCDPKAGSLFPLGVTTVKCTAFGPTGKTISETFDVTVADTTAPELSLPRDFATQAPAPDGAEVTYAASAKDAVDGETFADCYPASGSFFASGVTTVSCSTRDKAGNFSSGHFDVTVIPLFDDTVYSRKFTPIP